jgi:uncharacterized protein (DUF1800 family)
VSNETSQAPRWKPLEAAAGPPVTPPETSQQQNFFREAKAHYDAAINADIGFVERLVWFWSNPHFEYFR